MKEPKDKRTKEYKQWKNKKLKEESKGVGDTIKKVLDSKILKPITKVVVGWLFDSDDCGCEERRKKLNKLFPYKQKITFMNEEDYNWTLDFNKRLTNTISNDDLVRLSEIHASTFNHKYTKPCSCNPNLIKEWISDIITVQKEMKEEL